jgi:hypothetical protein
MRCSLGATLLLSLAGCGSALTAGAPEKPTDPVSTGIQPLEVLVDGETVLPDAPDVTTESLGHVDLSVEPPATARPVRRMDIDQLDASIERATRRRWRDRSGVAQFPAFADTLGKPNFTSRVDEDLSAGILFEKFLVDAATSTCTSAVTENEPAIFRFVGRDVPMNGSSRAAIVANVRYLVLRFHARALEPGDAALENWTWLFESTAFRTGQPALGWRAVCVALITHPDFVAY